MVAIRTGDFSHVFLLSTDLSDAFTIARSTGLSKYAAGLLLFFFTNTFEWLWIGFLIYEAAGSTVSLDPTLVRRVISL
jgi:hypothetical protein